jgi:hypothetical protein
MELKQLSTKLQLSDEKKPAHIFSVTENPKVFPSVYSPFRFCGENSTRKILAAATDQKFTQN